MDSLTFIIPVYNDERSVTMVITKSVAVGKKLRIPFRILVVNDASTDGSGKILSRLALRMKHLTVITHTTNAGYGQTIKELYASARTAWLFSLPGDYQIEPNQITKLWPHRTDADMIIGWRINRRDSPLRLGQSRMYNTLLRTMFGLPIHDVNSARLMKTSIMKSIPLTTSSAFIDAELVINALRAGFRIAEIPIAHRARAGVGANGGKLTTILPTVMDMIKFFFGP
ncbi:MAG: Glycosyl transferase, family 2 [Microgenomates group bacterium GW2011_GWC1_49_7]|nr:MAG: Glycosyl transferase, family 2 [Microgenomates group bacterium GW2011_GWC1_49_7]